MKSNKLNFILVFTVLIITLGSCSPKSEYKQNGSPEDILKIVLDGAMKNNYDAMFSYFVAINGNPVSQETKQQIRDSIERTPISIYSIKETADANSNSPEYAMLKNTKFNQMKIVSFTITEKNTQKLQENKFIFVQIQGSWKILLPTNSPAQSSVQTTNGNAQQPIANSPNAAQPIESQQPVVLKVSPEARTNYIGLWKAEKVFAYDQTTQQYKEGTLNTDLYFEYKPDATWCVMWNAQLAKCLKYDTYMVVDDIITQHQEGLTGSQYRYKWKIADKKMELTSEVLVNGIWQPFLRYVLVPLSYPSASQTTSSDSSPKIISFAVTPTTVKPGETVTIECHVTDDEQVLNAEMSYISPKSQDWPKPLYSGFTGTKTDKIFTVSHTDWDVGTYTVFCEATDVKLSKSPKIQATYQIVG